MLGLVIGQSSTRVNELGTQNSSGVWGDSGGTAPEGVLAGVVGTGDNIDAAYFANNSSVFPTVAVVNFNAGGKTGLFKTLMATSADGTCGIGGKGDMTCTGQIKSLTTTDGGSHQVETYAVQSPENWMEDFGSGRLENGTAVVQIEAVFGQTVSETADYHVFLTPKGDSRGLYVTNETPTSFEVHESGGGSSSLAFDYRIVAKRRGFEAQRLTDVTEMYQAGMKAALQKRTVQPAQLQKP
jgi:hypothetical protein